jgi:hypothetical protein
MKLIRLSALQSTIIAIACTNSLDPNRLLEVTLSPSRDVVTVGNSVDVTITVINRSAIVVTTSDPRSYGCPPAFIVVDARGQERRPPPQICLAIAYAPKNLLPGESIVIHNYWAGETAAEGGERIPLPPGQYSLKARVWSKNGIAESPTVNIRLE